MSVCGGRGAAVVFDADGRLTLFDVESEVGVYTTLLQIRLVKGERVTHLLCNPSLVYTDMHL